jgi:hypothetical protein
MPNLNPAPKKPHTAGILSFFTTLAGIAMTAGAYVAQAQSVASATGALPFVEGGRPSALKVFDERIAQLNAQPTQES